MGGSSDRVRIGFVGCGQHGSTIVYPSLRFTDLELVATSALTEEEARRNARLFGAERWHVRHDRLLELETDIAALVVVVQPFQYGEIVRDALARGLPVYAEKPAASSVAEVAELIEQARATGLPVCVGYMKRFAPAYELLHTAIGKPEFGRPSFFSGTFAMGEGVYTDDYSFLVDNSVHMVDLARYLMGEIAELAVKRAEGAGGRVAYAVALQFASGAVGTLHLSTLQSWEAHNERVEVTGEGMAAVVDNVVSYREYARSGPGAAWEPNFTVPLDENHFLSVAGYAPELQHFADVVRGRCSPRTTIEDSLRALEVIDRIYVTGGGVLHEGLRPTIRQ